MGVAVMLQVKQFDDFFGLFPRFELGVAHFSGEKKVLPHAGLAMGMAPDQQVVKHGGVLKKLNVLEGPCNTQIGDFVRWLLGKLFTQVGDLTGGWRVDAADQVEHCRLACTIGTNQGEDLARFDIKADVVDRQHATEAHAQIFGGEENIVHGQSRSAGPPQARHGPPGGQRSTRSDKRGGII